MWRTAAWLTGLAVTVGTLLPVGRESESSRSFDAPDAAHRYYEARRTPSGPVSDVQALYDLAMQQRLLATQFSSRAGRTLPYGESAKTAVLDAWTALGPGNIGGRTRVVRYHPTQPHVLVAAGVSGGLWKSDDTGITWRALGSDLANLAVNSFAIDPRAPHVMFAGTGEGYFREEIRGTALPLRGGGIFMTEDGGTSWRRVPNTHTADFHWVNDLELGTRDSRILYAATRTGVWRSTDRGESWVGLLGTQVRGGCLDLAISPNARDETLLVSCGSYEQATVYRIQRADRDASVEPVLSDPAMGRTSLAIAPSNPRVVYALAASNEPGPRNFYRQGLLAVYRSDNGGAPGSWSATTRNSDTPALNTLLLTNVNTALSCGGAFTASATNMGWYNNVIAVDPVDENRVWAAGVDWFRSDDGGRTWGLASTPRGPGPWQMHVDQHGIAFHPEYDGSTNQTLIVGNDGGIYRTTNARATVMPAQSAPCNASAIQIQWTSLNRGYAVTQFYRGMPFPDGTRYFGGTQDNGTVLGSDDQGGDGWRGIFGGDGGHVAIDSRNHDVIYAESQWAAIVKSTNGGQKWQQATRGLDAVRADVLGPDANYLFVTPFVIDPSNSDRLWTGGEFLYRTNNGASTWTKASAPMPDRGVMSAIAIAPDASDVVAAGTTKGDILGSRQALTADAQTNWPSSRPRDGWVTSLAFDPQDAKVLYATYGNFGGSHLYRSRDGGGTWQALDGGRDSVLPDIPVHCLVIDPDDGARLYLGTDLGVWVSVDGGQRWMVEATGFEAAVTEWLSLTRDSSGRKRLFAFTHGRGVWRVDIR
jgi:hypothetical protein